MANKFAVIGLSGIALCAICLTGAALLGGQELSQAGFDFGDWDKPRCDSGGGGEETTRQLSWDGSDKAEVDLPTDVHYRQGEGAMLEIKGPAAIVSQVRLHNGKVTLGCRRSYNMTITLPGRNFREFVFHGAGDVDLKNIDQPDLKITMMGAGDIAASGKTDRLEMTIMGAGDARMADLAAGTVHLTMMGAGDAEISPLDKLSLTSMGAGEVTLRHEPVQIESHIMGAGGIVHEARPDSDKPATPAAPETPKKD